MKIELIKASEDCFNQNTGFCYHYLTWQLILLIGLIAVIVYLIRS